MGSILLVEVAGAATGGDEADEAPPSAELRSPRDAALTDLGLATDGVLVGEVTETWGAPAEERLPFVVEEIEAPPA